VTGFAVMPGLFWYVTAILAWSKGGSPPEIRTVAIPKNFMIGTASSAYQVEGAWNESGKIFVTLKIVSHNHFINSKSEKRL
jgi:hypothetical protein